MRNAGLDEAQAGIKIQFSSVAQSYPTLSDPMDCSLPGSSVHGIFQARVLDWGAIAFSYHILNQYLTFTKTKFSWCAAIYEVAKSGT